MFYSEKSIVLSDVLPILENMWIRSAGGSITNIGELEAIKQPRDTLYELQSPHVCLPGLIDAHTHLCYAGSRAADFAGRLNGISEKAIASMGGGIMDTVRHTRLCNLQPLTEHLVQRLHTVMKQGVTTCEIKTGYGLNYDDEMKMLEAIRKASKEVSVSLVPTCFAAHIRPPEFNSDKEYLNFITHRILKTVVDGDFCHRLDISIDNYAFSPKEAKTYLKAAKNMGFDIIIHADQFQMEGSKLAAEVGALSADHLEASGLREFEILKQGNVIPIVLPGSCMGLGVPFPRCREILDANLPLVIATDWNPNSSLMGNLLLQASILAMSCKLKMAEVLAAITVRAASALRLSDRGMLKPGYRADMILFPTGDYQDILCSQGGMLPSAIFVNGCLVV